jgi:hypothetical protein
LSDYGSVLPGPSELYLKLLKGEIKPEEYARAAKKRVQDESRQRPEPAASQLKRT